MNMCLTFFFLNLLIAVVFRSPSNQEVSHATDAGLSQHQRIHGWNGRKTFWSLHILMDVDGQLVTEGNPCHFTLVRNAGKCQLFTLLESRNDCVDDSSPSGT